MNRISDLINDDNYVKIRSLGLPNLYLKIEGLNPAGSIKMKTAVGLISSLESQGKINPNTILIESSSGNLGVALSIICAERGYRFKCVVDPKASLQNIKMMESFGTEVAVVRHRDENGGFLGSRIAYIQDLIKQDSRYLWLNQYANPENPLAHARTTASSILFAFEQVDYLFVGAGTTGTLMGCLQHFSLHSPQTKVIAVDSVGSVTFGHSPSERHIPGLGTSRRPEIFASEGIHAVKMVHESDTIAMCRYLARTNGILSGGSTGTVISAIYQFRELFPADSIIVAISPDLGERYLDTIYDDPWVIERFGCIPTFRMIDEKRI